MRYVVVLIVGIVAGQFLGSTVTLVEADDYLPVPVVDARCDNWYITENAPDYYWDTDATEMGSRANYYTIDADPTPYTQGETAVIPAKPVSVYDRATFMITWWDTDVGEPQILERVGVSVHPTC